MYIAALDIGGTKTIVAILDENGGILIQESFPSIVDMRRIWNYAYRQ